MGRLWDSIRDGVRRGEIVVSLHADERCRERGLLVWQIVDASAKGRVISERLGAKPNPVAELEITLPDGTEAVAVWSWMPVSRTAKLVTVYVPEK